MPVADWIKNSIVIEQKKAIGKSCQTETKSWGHISAIEGNQEDRTKKREMERDNQKEESTDIQKQKCLPRFSLEKWNEKWEIQ